MSRRSQTLSLDLMIGIMIFIGIMIVFFGVMMFRTTGTDVSKLNREGEQIIKTLDSGIETSFIEESQISEKDLQALLDKDYDEIKATIGVDDNFCIFLEDNNQVVPIESKDGRLVAGIGSSKATIGGKTCEER